VAVRLGFRFALAALAVFAALVGSSAASAGPLLGLNNNCGATTKPFAQFGDQRLYTFGTNGGLESRSTGWSLSGSKIVSGNETYYVHSRSDANSLSLPSGSSALTPPLCMGTTSTVLRYFVSGNNSGSLRVQVVLHGLLGNVLGIVDVASIKAGTAWQPSPPLLNLDSLLGLIGVSSIQLKYTAVGGAFRVDDVYVDPWWND
jgi:hypothetical protein